MDLIAEWQRLQTDSRLPVETNDVVQHLLAQLQSRVEHTLRQHSETLQQRDETLRQRDLKIEALILELSHLRRLRYGVKNEALSSEQRELFDETLATDIAAAEARLEALQTGTPETEAPAQSTRAPRARAGRQALPAHLPRIDVRHEPASCTCADCGQERVKIGEDISEQLDVIPARFQVIRHIRPQYACRACETVVAAPVAPAIIDGGLPTAAMLAWVTLHKFGDHMPLYRIAQMADRQRVPLARATLAEWAGRTGVALTPLAERLREWLFRGTTLHGDETPVAQLDPGSGKTHRSYLWAWRSNDIEGGPPIIVFDYRESRAGRHARDFLGEWRGHLLVDDYSGYKALFGAEIIELGCWAHARRKFYELYQAQGSPIAEEALRRIGELYAIEQAGRDLAVDARQRLRAEQARPKLVTLFDWLRNTRTTVANGSGTARAIDYSLKRKPALTRYAETGHLPIDNNPVENAIRPIAIGKKNWLFVGSSRAGERAAALQTLIGTARLNGIEPFAWLQDTLEKLPSWPNSRIDELLPLPGWKAGTT
jgi:transposase